MDMPTKVRRVFNVVVVLSFLAFGQAANAATVTTDSNTVFAADTTGAVVGNFTGIPTPFGSPGQMYGGGNPLAGYASLQGVSFSTPNAGGAVNVNQGGLYGASDFQSPYLITSTYTGPLDNVLSITLPHPETAFGFDFNTLASSTTASFGLSNGYSTTATSPSSLGTAEFIGFLSDTAFDTVTFSVPNGQSLVITDFTQASAMVTPLPATWTFMLLAFAAMTFVTYRRPAKVRAN